MVYIGDRYNPIGRKLSSIALCLIGADIIFTTQWKEMFGIDVEFNIIGIILLSNDLLLVLKMVASFFVLLVIRDELFRLMYRLCLFSIILLYTCVIAYHIFIYLYLIITTQQCI